MKSPTSATNVSIALTNTRNVIDCNIVQIFLSATFFFLIARKQCLLWVLFYMYKKKSAKERNSMPTFVNILICKNFEVMKPMVFNQTRGNPMLCTEIVGMHRPHCTQNGGGGFTIDVHPEMSIVNPPPSQDWQKLLSHFDHALAMLNSLIVWWSR